MDRVPDETLEQIAKGNGHVYNHEGKSMATELLAFRHQAAAAAKLAAAAATPPPAPPDPNAFFPWGLVPGVAP